MNKDSSIYVAGHTGMVGAAIVRILMQNGYNNIITQSHQALDLTNQSATENFFSEQKPDYVFLAAAKVGGISANNRYRADFIYQNLAIQNNVIHQSYKYRVKKILFLGSTCIYPKKAKQSIVEEALLTGELEYTNEPYAIAKIAGLKLCENYNLQYKTNFMTAMPTNLYGQGDNFDFENSHVLPALMRKIHIAKQIDEKRYDGVLKDLQLSDIEQAKIYLSKIGVTASQVEIWGTGMPTRDFLHVDDLADACLFLMQEINFEDIIAMQNQATDNVRNTHINIGTGQGINIKDLAHLIARIIGFNGTLLFNSDKPDGTMEKLTAVHRLHRLGWQHKIQLAEGIRSVYQWYQREFA